MDDLHRLRLPPGQIAALPLGLRTIFYKDLPTATKGKGLHRIAPYKAKMLPNPGFHKPISRT